jgi:microcystin-dependent protein
MSGINYSGTSTFTNTKVTGITTAAILEVEGQLRDGDGNFGSAGQVLTSDGTDLKWDESSNLPAGSSAKIAITDVTSGTPRLLLSTGSGTQKDVLSNSSLTYDTSTQVITGKISSLSNHDTDDLSEGSSNLYHTTARARSAISASGDLNYNSSSGVMSFSAPSAFVQGMIIIWSGNTGDIPTGFKLCDGTFGTPNLTDRFVVGAGAAYSPGSAGGNNSQTLSVDQIPSHDHSLSASGQTDSGGSHFHYSFRSGNHGQLQNGSNMSSNNYPGSGSGRANLYEGYNINSSGSVANVGKTSDHNGHQHNFSLSGNTGAKGGGQSIDIRPKYYALCYIMKT